MSINLSMGSGDNLSADRREICLTISQGDGKLDCGGSDSASATSSLSDKPADSGAVAKSNYSSNRLPPAAGSLTSANQSSLQSLIPLARKNSVSSDDAATKIDINEDRANIENNDFDYDAETADLERRLPSNYTATKRFLVAGQKRSKTRYSRQYESYQCCGCRCKKLKPHQIALIVIFSVLLSAALCVTTFYIIVPIQVRAIMNLPEMAPQYSISDLRNDSFQVHIAQNVYMYSPISVQIDPYVLTVTVNNRQVGWLEANSYNISPGSNITANHTTRFIITDGPWLRQLGNSIMSSLANQIPYKLSIVVATTLSVHSLGFHWEVPYVRAGDLKTGEKPLTPSTANDTIAADSKKISNNSTAPPIVSVQNWTMSGLNGVTLNLAFNNPLPLAVDLDEVKVNILKSSKNLGQAIIPDLSVGMGQNLLSISLYIKNFFNAVGFGVNFMENAEEILQFQNITVTSRESGVQLSWINGWFDGVSFSMPFSKSILSQGRRR